MKTDRLDYVDGLRALAALYVTVYHMLLNVNDGLPDGMKRHVLGVFMFGHYAVDVFIVLSGFCLMLPVLRKGGISGGAWSFFKKRAWRILPPYYLAVALSLLLIRFFIGTPGATLWNSSLPVTRAGILSHLLLVQDAFSATNHRINYCLWSISVEWRIYFLFPLMVWGWNRFGPLRTVAAALAASFLLLVPLAYSPLDDSETGVCLHYYGLFALGMLAAGFGHSADPRLAKWRGRLPWAALHPLLFGLAVVSTKAGLSRGFPWQITDIFIALGTLSLLVAAESSGFIRAVLGWKPLVFVGTFSYSFYLLHAPLLEIVWRYFVLPLHLSPFRAFFMLCSFGLPAIIGASYLFFLVCERPFIRRGKPPVVRPAPLEPSLA